MLRNDSRAHTVFVCELHMEFEGAYVTALQDHLY